METTWKPTVAGILNIVSGVSGLLGGLVLALLALTAGVFLGFTAEEVAAKIPFAVGTGLFVTLAVLLLATSFVAVWGGIQAIRRQSWGWALAGSIAAIFVFWPLGVLAVVFTVMAEKEFPKAAAWAPAA